MPIFQSGQINTTALVVPNADVQIIPPQVANVNGLPTNIIGLVGTASYGPVNIPTLVGGSADYTAMFGPVLNRTFDAGTHLSMAVLQGANIFYMIRVTDGSDVAANVLIQSTCITFTSLYTGSYGNNITITIGAGAISGTYSVVVGMPGVLSEKFDNISGSGATLWANMAAAVNNGQNGLRGASNIVNATTSGGTTTPTLGSYTLAYGTDGVSSVTSSTIVGSDTVLGRTGMYQMRNLGISIGILSDLTDHTVWSTVAAFGEYEGIYFPVAGAGNESIATAASNLAASGASFYSLKAILGDYVFWNDQVNGMRPVSPISVAAGLMANQSPEQSTLNKPTYGVSGTQRGGNPNNTQQQTYSDAELTAIALAGLDVITNPIPAGNFYGFRFGKNASTSITTNGDNYTRLTNYVSRSLNAAMGIYIGRVITTDLLRNINSSITTFLNNMKLVGQIQAFSVKCDKTNNPFSRTSIGYVTADVQIQYGAILLNLIVNLEAGQTVQVTVANQ